MYENVAKFLKLVLLAVTQFSKFYSIKDKVLAVS